MIITFGDSIFHLNTETPLFCYSHCSERTNSCRGSMYREHFAGQLRSSKSQLHHSTTGIILVWLPSWWRLPLSYSFVVARCQIHCIMISKNAAYLNELLIRCISAELTRRSYACRPVNPIRLCAWPFFCFIASPGSRVVSVLDSGAEGPGFKSQPRHCRVTVLGKLFTPIVPLFTKQRNW